MRRKRQAMERVNLSVDQPQSEGWANSVSFRQLKVLCFAYP